MTGVCSTRNVDLVRSLGADDVIDYTKEDFTQRRQAYDLLLDVVANRSISDCRRVLQPEGIGVLAGAPHGGWTVIAYMLKIAVASKIGRPKVVTFMAEIRQEDLLVINKLIEAGKVMPVVDRTYPLSETAEALRYLEEGHARGKVVIVV